MVEAGKNGCPEASPAAVESAAVSSELLRTFIHELRNPLGPIRNAAELLRTLCTDPRQLQSVDIIARQVSSLTRAIEDLTGAIGATQSSRFAVTLPLSDDAGRPPSPARATPADALKVIIIDDHEDSVTSLRDVLAAAGHEVLVAGSGELGIALAEKFSPDAVIVDIGLPGMDGFEVARHLHESTVTADALLIAVSGFSLKQFRDLSAYAVFRHYLLKPASPETILAIIEGSCVRRRGSLAKKK